MMDTVGETGGRGKASEEGSISKVWMDWKRRILNVTYICREGIREMDDLQGVSTARNRANGEFTTDVGMEGRARDENSVLEFRRQCIYSTSR